MTQRMTTALYGFIRAVADQTHPLQTKLSLILTDFEPNRNKQAVPKSEAENIINTALHTPLKIHFDGAEYHGHKGAIPIGPIVEVYRSNDNGREVIAAEAVIWNDIYPEVSDHLKVAFAEGVGTSWEIYFDPDKTQKDSDNVEWLGGCVFAGTCVVETPAYGPNRTRLLAIAEQLQNRDDISLENNRMAQATNTQEQPVDPVIADAENTEAADTLTSDISGAIDMLSKLYEGLWTMVDEADQLERELATTDISTVAEQFAKAISGIQKRFEALKDKAAKAESVELELTQLKDAIAEADKQKAVAEKLASRKATLAEVGIELSTDKQELYLGMEDTVFNQYIEDLKVVRSKHAKAESVIIPEPTGSANTTISISELAAILRSNS